MSSSQTSSSSSDAAHPLSGMLDLRCDVDVIIGHTSITVRECLQLTRDSVIRLVQPAGGDLRVRVQGVPIATGEVVIVDDSTAVRVLQVLPPPGAEA